MKENAKIENKHPPFRKSDSSFNQGEQTYFFGPVVQAKLSINQPGDIYEQEADAMADKVMRMPAPGSHASGGQTFFNPTPVYISRKQHLPEDELDKEIIHRKESESHPIQRKPAPDMIHDPLLDSYSDYSGQQRNNVSQHDPDYERWLKLSLDLSDNLQKLINEATWPEIRKRVYPKESAAGIQRAKDRHSLKIPDLTGLGKLTSLNHFATSIKNIQTRWNTIPSPDDKVKAIGKAANDELKSADVPAFRIVHKEPLEIKGYFSSGDWKFAISEQLVNKPALSNDEAAEVANTTLHESRHAEQRFLSARFSAGINNLNATDLHNEQHMHIDIATAAVANKFNSGTDQATKDFGKQIYQANTTDRVSNQIVSNDDGWTEMADLRKEAQKALQKLNQGATSTAVAEAQQAFNALKTQITVVEQKYTLYRRIPYEADAHEVGDAAELAFRGW